MEAKEVTRLGSRVQQSRDAQFTGRITEVSLFRAALAETEMCPVVLYCHGPGGVGKSMLLHKFAAEARAAGRRVTEIDGDSIDRMPEAFELQAGAVLDGAQSVLLIDSFDRCQDLEGWLRDFFLPRICEGILVVIAGRVAPNAEWTSDPGWRRILRSIPLHDFSPDESRAFLFLQGTPEPMWPRILKFTGGHPLALALAALSATEQGTPGTDWEPRSEMIATLLKRMVGKIPTLNHRRALEVCALSRVTNEALLRAVLGSEATELFDWLRELPFVDIERHGIHPCNVVREVLDADLRWRDPDGYADLLGQLGRYQLDQLRRSADWNMPSAVRAFLYLYRSDESVPDSFNSHGDEEVLVDTCTPADRSAVLDLVESIEGVESASFARYWLKRQPEAFRTCRSLRDGQIVGFSAWLKLSDSSDAKCDPVTAAAWIHTQETTKIREGESVAVARFSVTSPSCPSASTVEEVHRLRSFAEIFRADGRLAHAYIGVCPEQDAWARFYASLGFESIAPRPRVGDAVCHLIASDRRKKSASDWTELKTRLLSGASQTPLMSWQEDKDPDTEPLVLSRSEFDAAVRDALRSLSSPQKLTVNPLSRTRVAAQLSLGDLLLQAVDGLRAGRGGEKYHRAVAATYLSPGAPLQQAVAARLGLPFSTYRRHLASGVRRVSDALWHREIYGPSPGC